MIAQLSIPTWLQLGSVVKIVGHPTYNGIHASITSFPNRNSAIVNIPGVGRETIDKSYIKPLEECTHSWQPCWNESGELVDYCWGCNSTKEITDKAIFNTWKQKITEVVDGYQKEFDKSKSKGKREQVGRAIARCHEQLEWLKKKLPTEKEQENYETITSMIPASCLATGGGAEENNTEIPAMDNTTTATVDAVFDFVVGDRVTHSNGRFTGIVTELDSRLATPQVWVQPDVDPDCDPKASKPFSPSDLIKVKEIIPVVENTTAVTIGISNELTIEEENDRHLLERKVERAFYEAGKALQEIRDRKLYRSTHKTFEAYCKDRFGFNRISAHNKIAAAQVVENLFSNAEQKLQLPTSERQCLSLATLEPEKQIEVWSKAVEQSRGKIPSGKIVKGIVETLKEKPLHYASEYCSKGEIFILQRLKGKDSKYDGHWAVAIEVENRFTVKCRVYDGTNLDVRQENMKRQDLTDVQQAFQQEMLERISRLARVDLPPAIWGTIEKLSTLRNYTDLELHVLATVEAWYNLNNNHDQETNSRTTTTTTADSR